MTITQFDDVFRAALWNTYKNKCFYCMRLLNWNEYQIDHLIPEWLQNEPERLNKLISDYGLDNDFDVNAHYNLVPAHMQCNNRKRGQIFEKEPVLFYIQLSKAKENTLSKEIEAAKNKKNKSAIFAKVQAALATGLIDHHEMEHLLQTARENYWSSQSIELSDEINYIDGVIKTFYLSGDYSWLQDKHIPHNEIDMVNDEGNQTVAQTLQEFNRALKEGFYPKTNIDIKGASGFTFLESFLELLKGATMPKISFVDEPRLTLQNLAYLSPTILFDIEDNLKIHVEKGLSVQDLVNAGLIEVKSPHQYEVTLEFNNFQISLREQFRADFNGDGIEDIFVQTWTNAVGGSLGFGDSMVLTRYSNRHLIEPAK